MTFMTYLARRTKHLTSPFETKPTPHQQQKQSSSPSTKPSLRPINSRQKKDIGEYWLGKTIGRGASGRVKLGIHKHTGEKVAIKMIARSHLVSSITTAKAVQRELAVLQLLHHPHLVELKQVLQDSFYVYFIMEYLEGGELFHILAEKGKFKETDARALFYQMVSGLAWCHAHHICHRDLKPENILLDKSKKQIKIADFGMAAMNTSLKTSCGSPHYASPEIVKGKAYDGTCTDVWSLGVILFALLSGHLPFDDENMGRLLGKIKTGRYRPLPHSLSNEAKHLVKKMLVVEPHKRITMNEILNHPWLALSPSASHQHHPRVNQTLEAPMISHTLDLEGRIWETLKVLWRDLRQEEIIRALSSHGFNLQKLTCLLLEQRASRMEHENGKGSCQEPDSRATSSVRRTYSVDKSYVQTPTVGKYNRMMHHRNGSDEVESKCSLATPYDSAISNVSCTRTIEMPPTPKNTTFDKDLTMESNTLLTMKKPWDRCDHAAVFENGDACMNCPQQQENASSSIRSRWIYQAQQLVLAPSFSQYCHYSGQQQDIQQQEDITRSSNQQEQCLNSPLSNNNICLTSLHVEGGIQPQASTASSDKLSALASTKCLPTTYNLLENLHRQHSFAATHHQRSSPSLTSMFQSLWPLPALNKINTNMTTPSTDVSPPASNWWSKTLDYVLHSWTKKQPKSVTFDCHGKHECEVAGKIHQVLKEHLDGKLRGRIYPNKQILWNGTINMVPSSNNSDDASSSSSSKLLFLCQMVPQHGRHFKVNLVYVKGNVSLWNPGTEKLISTLLHYEQEANKVMMANGW
ncbi:kinase-like domain-containing protein [Chlamydoabsidia padenii]|nr:kinase-like domain-containing protein [Chlamydoabsidia padenii]